MSESTTKLTGPDFESGVKLSEIDDGAMLRGHAFGEQVLLARRGAEIFAIGAVCTHYGAPLETGLLVGETVRCPWHHACFSLRTGEALRAPALAPVSRFRVELVRKSSDSGSLEEDSAVDVFVREKLEAFAPNPLSASASSPASVIIIGGGAAGNAAAEALRNKGYVGGVTILSADEDLPCDRPNLSKDYLAGTAPDDYNILRSTAFYKQHDIHLRLGARVTAIKAAARHVELADGSTLEYGALLLATGAAPVRLDIPGADLSHVHYLRTLSDAQALVTAAQSAKHAVVIGASFIGLEVAASLRARNIGVHVVGTETTLMNKVLGPNVGDHILRLHEEHGVTFHLGTTATAIEDNAVVLKSGERITADLVVIGIGVRPEMSLAERAGLAIDHGVVVDAYLQTSVPGIYAAGDIARWPDRISGDHIRVEHWVVAECQGQVAAHNMLGDAERFDHVPFFWTKHYDFQIAYVGHAEEWDEAAIDGSLDGDCTISYRRKGQTLAKAFVGRDLDGLRSEVAFERQLAAGDAQHAAAMRDE